MTDLRIDVLALAAKAETVDGLYPVLCEAGLHLDIVTSRADALALFQDSGGHQVLVLGPDLCPAVARATLKSLRAVHQDLLVVVFGDPLHQDKAQPKVRWLKTIPQFSPCSRAGAVALLKAIRTWFA